MTVPPASRRPLSVPARLGVRVLLAASAGAGCSQPVVPPADVVAIDARDAAHSDVGSELRGVTALADGALVLADGARVLADGAAAPLPCEEAFTGYPHLCCADTRANPDAGVYCNDFHCYTEGCLIIPVEHTVCSPAEIAARMPCPNMA